MGCVGLVLLVLALGQLLEQGGLRFEGYGRLVISRRGSTWFARTMPSAYISWGILGVMALGGPLVAWAAIGSLMDWRRRKRRNGAV